MHYVCLFNCLTLATSTFPERWIQITVSADLLILLLFYCHSGGSRCFDNTATADMDPRPTEDSKE